MLCCGAVCGGRVREGIILLVHLSASFQSILPLHSSKLSFVVLIPWRVGLCTSWHLKKPWNGLLCETQYSPLLQPLQVFIGRSFMALVSCAGSLDCGVCLIFPLFSMFICSTAWSINCCLTTPVNQPLPHTLGMPPAASLLIIFTLTACLCSSYQSG